MICSCVVGGFDLLGYLVLLSLLVLLRLAPGSALRHLAWSLPVILFLLLQLILLLGVIDLTWFLSCSTNSRSWSPCSSSWSSNTLPALVWLSDFLAMVATAELGICAEASAWTGWRGRPGSGAYCRFWAVLYGPGCVVRLQLSPEVLFYLNSTLLSVSPSLFSLQTSCILRIYCAARVCAGAISLGSVIAIAHAAVLQRANDEQRGGTSGRCVLPVSAAPAVPRTNKFVPLLATPSSIGLQFHCFLGFIYILVSICLFLPQSCSFCFADGIGGYRVELKDQNLCALLNILLNLILFFCAYQDKSLSFTPSIPIAKTKINFCTWIYVQIRAQKLFFF